MRARNFKVLATCIRSQSNASFFGIFSKMSGITGENSRDISGTNLTDFPWKSEFSEIDLAVFHIPSVHTPCSGTHPLNAARGTHPPERTHRNAPAETAPFISVRTSLVTTQVCVRLPMYKCALPIWISYSSVTRMTLHGADELIASKSYLPI